MSDKYKAKMFVDQLLKWAHKNLRRFPWRNTKDPYKILIAEILLQRTKAEQVEPIFKQFISKYPNIKSLNHASANEIKATIFSLGLEKRAEGLKRMANQIVTEYKSRISNDRDELLRLYGVGSYIANAILCHAYDEDALTVDANFARVLDRVFSLKLRRPAQKDKRVKDFANKLLRLSSGQCRILNLSIIDLASQICTPRNPSCNICPLNKMCDHGLKVLRELNLKKGESIG
jgi:A/G-specific adenine glycosylase